MKGLIVILIMCSCLITRAQNINISDTTVYTTVEQMPEFPGGQDDLLKWLGKNLKFPQKEMCLNLSTFRLSCIIEKDGSISTISVSGNNPKPCTDEFIKGIETMPAWQPGKQGGVPVRVRFTIPIRIEIR